MLREQCAASPRTRSRRAREIDRDNVFPRGPVAASWATSACSASPWRRSTAAPAWATSRTSSRWRRSRARSASRRPLLRRALQPVRQPDPAQRQRGAEAQYLPKLISGEHVGALAMSEPGAGSDVVSHAPARREAGRPLRAQRQQDVDHQRPRCRRAGRLRQDRPGRRGRAASPPSSSRRACKGFSTAQKLDKLGMRGSNTCELVFEDCEVPAENVPRQRRRAA